MKKLSKIFAVALCLAMVLAILPMGASAAANTVTYDFKDLPVAAANDYNEMDADALLTAFKAAASGSGLESVTGTKIFKGNNSDSGAYPQSGGMLKTGSSKAAGQLVLTFSKKVTKVEILCHDWFTPSEKYPTNSNTVAVNGSDTQLPAYNSEGKAETLTFDLATASETVTIDFNKRVFVKSITVTFEGATQNPPAGGDNTQNPPAGGDNTQTPPAGGDTEKPDDAGDNTAIVAMTSVMAVAVVALAVLVIGKKRMF